MWSERHRLSSNSTVEKHHFQIFSRGSSRHFISEDDSTEWEWAINQSKAVGQMADDTLLGKIHDLSDVELAALLCLVTQEHCIIDTEPEFIDELVQELELVSGHRGFFTISAKRLPGCS